MRTTLLYSVVVYSIGCIIPTPLVEDPAEMNYAPVFVTSQVQPLFGPITHSAQDYVTFNFVADDPNLHDMLKVRLFIGPSPSELTYPNLKDVDLSPSSDPNNPQRHVGQSDSFQICQVLHSGDLYAVVADRDFDKDNPTLVTGGLTDENHWDLTCM